MHEVRFHNRSPFVLKHNIQSTSASDLEFLLPISTKDRGEKDEDILSESSRMYRLEWKCN